MVVPLALVMRHRLLGQAGHAEQLLQLHPAGFFIREVGTTWLFMQAADAQGTGCRVQADTGCRQSKSAFTDGKAGATTDNAEPSLLPAIQLSELASSCL
jgi:hypothetical protein